MKVEQITVPGDWYEPYRIALGYRIGDVIVLSGQAAIAPSGEIVGIGDFDAQADQVFRNLTLVLEAAGSGLEHVVKVTIFMTDMIHFPKIVELRERWFTPPYPADTIVEVRSLALPELMLEIEAIAIVPDA
jgi:2-iminobutanoate/2-iminopropanoate deaminase